MMKKLENTFPNSSLIEFFSDFYLGSRVSKQEQTLVTKVFKCIFQKKLLWDFQRKDIVKTLENTFLNSSLIGIFF